MRREHESATPDVIAEVTRVMELTRTPIDDVLAEVFFGWEDADILAALPARLVEQALRFVQGVEYASTHHTVLDDYLERLKSP